ncbi:ABC transporter substrate-binding protein [Nocardia sp. 348MFTsu5.1]|uniref:ABC transporter substrate-binding protein n=1 Tax=Nocardia sp. 348MFTsu5.1 TaxID=1172185 RepID=UPI00039BABA5|nr:ABC transporter substrate-binding protein [Nocardia sp. 348MFTsu5.1]
MRKRTGRIAAAFIAAVCVFSVVSCSDDSDSGSDSSAAPSESGTKATGAPIKVGFLNPSQGPITQPGVETGQKAAVNYINNTIGGVAGRPLEVVNCAVDVTAPESTIGCANQLVQAGVVAVIDGYDAASSAALPILKSANIPLVGQIPFDSVTGASPDNRVYFGPPQASFLIGVMQSLKQQGKTSLTLANVDVASAHQTFDRILKPLGAQLGLDVNSVYYSATNPNYTALASTINSTNPDVGGLMTSQTDANCTKLAQSLQSVGFKNTMFMAACTEFIDTMGAQAVGSQTYSPIWLAPSKDAAPPAMQENLDITAKYVEDEGGNGGFYAYGTFATFVDFARTLGAAAPAEITGPTVLAALKAVNGYQSWLGPVLGCGKATSPNCTTEMFVFEVTADKKTAPIGGGLIQPAPQVLAMIPGAS